MNETPQLRFLDMAGYEQIPKDNEAFEIWKRVGLNDNQIYYYGIELELVGTGRGNGALRTGHGNFL